MTNFRLFILVGMGRPTSPHLLFNISHLFYFFVNKKVPFFLTPNHNIHKPVSGRSHRLQHKMHLAPIQYEENVKLQFSPESQLHRLDSLPNQRGNFDASSNGDNSVVTSNSMSNLRFILIETCYPIKRHHNIVCSSWFISPALYSPATVGGWQKRSVSVS